MTIIKNISASILTLIVLPFAIVAGIFVAPFMKDEEFN